MKLIEQAEPELFRSNQVFWLNKLDDELDNLRMALEWALVKMWNLVFNYWLLHNLFWDARSDLQEVESWLNTIIGAL